MRKFKKGDTVRVNERFVGDAQAGATATVVEYYTGDYHDQEYLRVIWNRSDGRAKKQRDGGYYEYSFDLVAEDKGKYTLAWLEDGELMYMGGDAYSTQREADEHANRLAAENADTVVVVLKAVSKHSSEVRVHTEAM